MENKNTIIALILMLAVWVGFSFLTSPSPKAPSAQTAGSTSHAVHQGSTTVQKAAPATVVSSAVVVPVVSHEEDVTIDTGLFKAVLTNAGARIKSFTLKKYRVSVNPQSAPVALVNADSAANATLATTGTGGFGVTPDTLYAVADGGKTLSLTKNQSRKIVFKALCANGLVVEKIYTFHGDRYDFDLSVRVINQGNTTASGAFELSLVHPWDKTMHSTRYNFIGPSTLVGNKLHNDKVSDLEKNSLDYADNVTWTAFSTKYFMTAVVPLDSARGKVQLRKENDFIFNTIDAPPLSLIPGHEADYHYLVYFGPRDLEVLKKVDHHLAKAIDFGFFSILAVPLLYVLKFFYTYVGNYGIAIIIVTVIIKLIFWPLTQKSYTSMKAMQKLQPQMQKIREKHKNDRERLNREIMELYKAHRVNPLGGCLPMVVQIPVFFALYEMLLGSIELRHAYFAFWLTDLSAKDPYYITPLIMGVTMFIQQKMSPTSMDPTQAKLFMLMPVVFTFLFLNFPSGLVLYWLVNNILTIVQQWFINKKADAQPA